MGLSLRRALRGLSGFLPVVSLVLAAFLGSAGVGAADLAHSGFTCRQEMSAAVNVDMAHCGLSGSTSECASHAGCLSVTLPATQDIVIALRLQRWPLPSATDEPGVELLLNTPPPIPAI